MERDKETWRGGRGVGFHSQQIRIVALKLASNEGHRWLWASVFARQVGFLEKGSTYHGSNPRCFGVTTNLFKDMIGHLFWKNITFCFKIHFKY